MCGISVIVALHGQNQHLKPVSPQENDYTQSPHEHVNAKEAESRLAKELNDSLELIKHRGPDDRGQWISPDRRVALGHVRLAINDLSPDGNQPFHDTDGTVHAVVNGELYDYEDIRKDLEETTDYRFRGHSDCEIVIALYKYYGLSFLSKLRGEFALCLYDSRTQFFVAARDRYGIKPLFWTIVDGRLLIAAEAKAFLALGWKPEWDVKSLLDAGWNHDERTLFIGVQKVRPGHYLTCQSFGHMETRKYWDLDYPNKRLLDTRTEAAMIAGVRELMLEAIRIRLRADVPVGVYLSGGVDSSAIAGMVTHLVKEQGTKLGNDKGAERVSCFSIAFDEDSGFDESSIANRTAEFLGVKYHKKHMNEAELAARYEDATWHCEHHNPDLNYVGKYALSEVPTDLGFKVVLTGEGADEHFAGYYTYLPDYLRESDQASMHNPLPEFKRLEQYEKTEEAARKYYEEFGADSTNRGESVARRMLNDITTVASMAAFFPPVFAEWTKCYGDCDPRLTIAHNIDGCTRDCITDKWHPLHSAQYVWTKGHLANIFLSCLGDRTEMAHSLEARTPFLDHKLTQYVNGLPPSVKLRWDQKQERFIEKWVLREASKPFITTELYERKKHPYTAPTTYPVDGPLHKLLARLITESNIARLGFVDWGKVKGLVDKAFRHEDPNAMRLALTVSQWVVLSQRFGVRRAKDPMKTDKEAPNSVLERHIVPQQMKESRSGNDMDRSGPTPTRLATITWSLQKEKDQFANDEEMDDVHPDGNDPKLESANGEFRPILHFHRTGKPTGAAETMLQDLHGDEEGSRKASKFDAQSSEGRGQLTTARNTEHDTAFSRQFEIQEDAAATLSRSMLDGAMSGYLQSTPLGLSLPSPRAKRVNSSKSEQYLGGKEDFQTEEKRRSKSEPTLIRDGEGALTLEDNVEEDMETQNRPCAPSSPTKRTRILEPGDSIEGQAQAKRVRIREPTEGTGTEVGTETADMRTAGKLAYLGYMTVGRVAEWMKAEHLQRVAEEKDEIMLGLESEYGGINPEKAADREINEGKRKETGTHISIEEVGEESREASDYGCHDGVEEVMEEDMNDADLLWDEEEEENRKGKSDADLMWEEERRRSRRKLLTGVRRWREFWR